MICEYCREDKCGCGAHKMFEPQKERGNKWGFFYNGCVVFVEEEFFRDSRRYYFFLGKELLASLRFSRQYLEENVPEYADPMSFIWPIFELTQGYRDNIEIIKKNNDGREYLVTITVSSVKDEPGLVVE